MRPEDVAALRGPILVLGAGGFIGANLVHHLRKHRSDITAAAHSADSWRLRSIPEVQRVDITSPADVAALLDDVRPQTVFDCTSFGGYAFQSDSERIYQVNFNGVMNVVEALAARGFTAYVHAGSSSEYGANSAGPSEDSPLTPNSHYAVSKAAAASYLTYAGRQRDLPVVNLRLYSVYGPMEEPSRLVPTLVDAAVSGGSVALANPSSVRDFVFVDDVCEAFVLAAVRMSPEVAGASLNIGSGTETSVRELVELVRGLNPSIEPEYGAMDAKPWEVPRWFADPARARAMIGWTATTSLEAGLEATLRWQTDQVAQDRRPLSASKAKCPSVAAVIACYNEGPAVPVMAERLTATFQRIGCDYEIIFVNNGSTDGTRENLIEMSAVDPHIIGINHSRSFGSQMAFFSGMDLASKDYVVILDGDLQDPPELIEEMYHKAQEGYDVVYGHRVRREMSRASEAPYRAFYRLFQATSDIEIPTDAGDFSLLTRPVVDWMLQSSERDLFVRGIRAYVGFRQTGVDYVRPDRMFGKSTNNIGKNIGWAKKAIFAYSRKPLDLLTSTGFIFLGISVVVILGQLVLRLIMPAGSPQGFTSTFLSIWLLGSLILLGIGILGEYLSKVLDEVKERPRWIRESLIREGRELPAPAPRTRPR